MVCSVMQAADLPSPAPPYIKEMTACQIPLPAMHKSGIISGLHMPVRRFHNPALFVFRTRYISQPHSFYPPTDTLTKILLLPLCRYMPNTYSLCLWCPACYGYRNTVIAVILFWIIYKKIPLLPLYRYIPDDHSNNIIVVIPLYEHPNTHSLCLW